MTSAIDKKSTNILSTIKTGMENGLCPRQYGSVG